MNALKSSLMILLMWSISFTAQAAEATGIDAFIEQNVAPYTNIFVNFIFYSVPIGEAKFPLIVAWLAIAATIFTIYFGFIQLRGFGHAIALVSGKYSDPNDAGEVSHFQALTTALSGTVGLGNIAGVAVAISIGGPGATFWMILVGFLGMASKFVECTLAVKYRRENADGTISGGPMYSLSRGLAAKGMPGIGKFLAVFFAVCCILGSLGGGNMFQSNQAALQIVNVLGGEETWIGQNRWVIGVIFAVLVGVVIIGGIKSIAKVTEKIVPSMAVIYLGAALVVILMNLSAVPAAFGLIIDGAFTGAGVVGGVIGVMIQGFKRATFSNEAGVGSAAIAHSAVRTKEPMTEGLVSLLEPFIDTVIICTMTALVIVITGLHTNPDNLGGVALTSAAFESAMPWFKYVLVIAVVLFAFSTMISWSYYGSKAWTYLFGENKFSDMLFKLIFCIFVVIGSAMGLGPVIDFSDAAIFAMSIANIIGCYLLLDVVKTEAQSYFARLKSGEIRRFK